MMCIKGMLLMLLGYMNTGVIRISLKLQTPLNAETEQ